MIGGAGEVDGATSAECGRRGNARRKELEGTGQANPLATATDFRASR